MNFVPEDCKCPLGTALARMTPGSNNTPQDTLSTHELLQSCSSPRHKLWALLILQRNSYPQDKECTSQPMRRYNTHFSILFRWLNRRDKNTPLCKSDSFQSPPEPKTLPRTDWGILPLEGSSSLQGMVCMMPILLPRTFQRDRRRDPVILVRNKSLLGKWCIQLRLPYCKYPKDRAFVL